MNFKEIYEGWKNSLFPPEKLKELIEETAKIRLAICKDCEWNSTPNKIKMWSVCNNCGCPLTKKTRCLSCKCPLEPAKWDAVATHEENEEIRKELNDES